MSDGGAQSTACVVEWPETIVGMSAVKRAAYTLMHRVTVDFASINGVIQCKLNPIGDAGDIERDFRREVLDQELRLGIEAETADLRNAILGLAFSKTGLQG